MSEFMVLTNRNLLGLKASTPFDHTITLVLSLRLKFDYFTVGLLSLAFSK